MPYVTTEVWVDEPECDGNCESAKDLAAIEATIDEAVRLLKRGDAEAALAALLNEATEMKSPDQIAESYKRWKDGRLPGFTNYQPVQ